MSILEYLIQVNSNSFLPMIQNKISYIVSEYGLNDVPREDKKFFHSHVCAHNYGLSHEDESVADFLDKSKEQIQANWDFVEARYHSYVGLLASRLNEIHQKEYSIDFWYRAFSLGLLRNISSIHMFFSIAEKYFDPHFHTLKILPKENYEYCGNFEEQRDLLTSSWLGQEQLLSMYVECFYPDYYDRLKECGEILVVPQGSTVLVKKKPSLRLKLLNILKKTTKLRMVVRRIYTKSYSLAKRKKIVVGVMGSFFSLSYFVELLEKSRGKVQAIPIIPMDPFAELDLNKRAFLFDISGDLDRFDRFFFFVSMYFFPKVLVENFQASVNACSSRLRQLPKLKYIVSEAWLGSTSINLFRALALEVCGIKSLYNEHNCVFHPYIGDYVRLESELVDQYLTFGWKGAEPEFISSSSLFPFTIPERVKKYHILYVSYPAEQYKAIYTGSYQAGYAAVSHLNFVMDFFVGIPNNLLRIFSYRGYPTDYFILGLRYPKERILDQYLRHMNIVSSFKNKGETCKEQMASSRLVVIDYLSTAYLESLMMNIPTICFWGPDIMPLKDEHSNFYDDLIEAKIVHTTPESAVAHLLAVYENPSIWWEDPKTQESKEKWLSCNFGEPELLIDYLVKLSEMESPK